MSNLNQAIDSWIESLHAYIKYSPAEITPLMKLESDMRKFLEAKPEPTEFAEEIRNRVFAGGMKRSNMSGDEIRLLATCDEIDRLKEIVEHQSGMMSVYQTKIKELKKVFKDMEQLYRHVCNKKAIVHKEVNSLKAELNAKENHKKSNRCNCGYC